MEWTKRLNSAINYIEEGLQGEIDLEGAARIAGCSAYHFQRMFSYMADISLSEYIRRRKMSLAAVELKDAGAKVLDIGLKYGYDSPTAFNRAFQSVHGFAPSKVKEEGALVKAYPPIHFSVMIKGDTEMNYRIEQKEAFRIVGIARQMGSNQDENDIIAPKMWMEATQNGTLQKLASMMNSKQKGLLGVGIGADLSNMQYAISVATTLPVPDGMEEFEIPAETWAIFSGIGTSAQIQELEKRIVMEWLPTSGYEYADSPDVEVYYDSNPSGMQYEVWLPVVRSTDKMKN